MSKTLFWPWRRFFFPRCELKHSCESPTARKEVSVSFVRGSRRTKRSHSLTPGHSWTVTPRLWRVALVTALSTTGCASPMNLFSKKTEKPQSFEEFRAQEMAKRNQVPSSNSLPGGPAEVAELLNKGHAAFQQGNLLDAQANYLEVVKRQPNHATANHRLAVIADRQQDFFSAERYYQAAYAVAPTDANLLNDIGYSYLLQSRFNEAEQYLQLALKRNPSHNNAINNLGTLYAKQGRADQSLAYFRRVTNDADAQARVAQLLPAGMNVAAPGTMLANNTWAPPQNIAHANWNPNSPGVLPTASFIPTQGQGQTQFIPTQAGVPVQTVPYSQQPPNAAIAAQSAVNHPNLSPAERELREAMERERVRAVAERQARDLAERQRQAALLRQVRDEALGTPKVVPASDSQWGVGVRTAPNPNTNGAIVNEPPVQNNFGGLNPPQVSNFPNGSPPNMTGFPAAPVRNWAGSAAPTGQATAVPMNVAPNANAPQTMNPHVGATNAASPLDAMPTWPPPEAMRDVPRNAAPPSSTPSPNFPNLNPSPNAAWPSGAPANLPDDPARAASRLGMNAGPGSLFPITPGSTAAVPNGVGGANGPLPNSGAPQIPPNWPGHGGSGASSGFVMPNFGTSSNGTVPNGNFAPQTAPQSRGAIQGAPPTFGAPPNGSSAEPPNGTFGPGNFSTSANTQGLPPSPSQFALKDQVPPSEQFRAPAAFGETRNVQNLPAQTASFQPNRSMPRGDAPANSRELIAEMERVSARSAPGNQAGADARWEQGANGNAWNPQSPPIRQGFLAVPADERSLTDYERQMQTLDAETDAIRQQLDRQRQLPSSENYYQQRMPAQAGTPSQPQRR